MLNLGPGHHFGEWFGLGIQRGYGLKERQFRLFNTYRWGDINIRPDCCGVVPILYKGEFNTFEIEKTILDLKIFGSVAVPHYPRPEGIVIFHTAANIGFKKTIEHDDIPKSLIK